MPWDSKSAKGFTKKANTPKKQRQWSAIANSALAKGMDDGEAVKMANGVIKNRVKSKLME